MAFLLDTGIKIVDKLVDSTVGLVIRQVGYVVNYKENRKKVEDQVRDLDAAKQSVEERVGQEKKNIREADAEVENWLTDVKDITSVASKILNREEKKVLCGLCPNLVLRHQQSRNSTKLVPDLDKLLLKRKDFITYAHATTLQDLPNKDYEAFGSRTWVVNQIMDVFRNRPDVNRIGVYGLGGMGKTTLVKEVSRQAREGKTLFDDVAMILDVKQNPSIERIQKEIADKLEVKLPEDDNIEGRARLLYNRIKDQKTLVILDDVWEKIDLEAVGLSGAATCKVLVTSRTREVLSNEMLTQQEFVLDRLGEKESWNLFEKMAGDVIKKDPAIKTVATKIAKRCGGLPVLIVTVASALRSKSTVYAWNDALTRLKRFDKEKFTEKTYLALEWSYSQLNDEELKSLFLFCGFNANSWKTISIEYLYKYGIGLDFFKSLNTMGEAWNALNLRLEKLKDACLLLDDEGSGYVKMHDLVHDVAMRILSREQYVLKVTGRDELREWPESKDFFEKCTMIILEKPNIPKLPEVLQCTELKFFLLNLLDARVALEIPCNFFRETTKLAVLDLTSMSIPSLPTSFQFLKSLKTLCLDWCTLGDIALIGQLQDLEMLSFAGSKFNELPKEIGKLTHLRSLDMTNCSQLKFIPPNVLSSLKKLEELKMGDSLNRWEAEGVNNSGTEKKNASLSELKHLYKLTCLQLSVKDANMLPTNLFSNALERYHIYIGDEWSWYDLDENLNTLKIKLTNSNELKQSGVNMLLKRTDELQLNGTEAGYNTACQLDGEEFQQLKYLHIQHAEFGHIINGKGVSPNLKRLVVSNLDRSTFLLSSSMARSLVQLTHLEISKCPTMEEIVSTEESDGKHMKDMFSKLEHLKLDDLPVLTRFSTKRIRQESHDEIEDIDSKEDLGNAFFDKTVVFPSLKKLVIKRLTKLMTIWDNQLSPESFKNLENVNIWSCDSLKSVFPSSMVGSLQRLLYLEVNSCGVEEIIANEDGPLQATHDQFVFSKVNDVEFNNLPHLRCFYPGMHVSKWPSLEELKVYNCTRIAFLAEECSSFEKNCEAMSHTPTNQALLLINKDSLPNLKRLYMLNMEIWDGPFPVTFFSKLESLQVSGNPHTKSTTVLEKFLGLDKESFLEKGVLRHLRELRLTRMHLGEDNSQVPGQNFPNLEALKIYNCDGLRNLRSSAVSFTNLTALNVDGCPELEYLITCSTAKSLTQLKILTVEDCASLTAIVGGTTDDDDGLATEILFSRLTRLKLRKLPRLQGFCSGDCTVKFPSLETLFMSKRVKLKIFRNDEMRELTYEMTDTDVEDDDGEKTTTVENASNRTASNGEQVDETRHITKEDEDANFDGSEHIQPLEITVSNQGAKAPVKEFVDIIPKGEITTPVLPVIEPRPVAEAPCIEEVRAQEFSCQNLEPSPPPLPVEQVHETQQITNENEDANFDGSTTTEKNVDKDTNVNREQVHETQHITNENEDAKKHVQHLETTATDQGVIEPVDENLPIIPIGEVTTPVFPVMEPPPVAEVPCTHEEVGERKFSCQNLEPQAEEARPDVHKTPPNSPEQPVEVQTRTPTPIIHALPPPKPSGVKRSLREKIEALSATSSYSLSEEAKADLNSLIATADLKDPHTRHHLLEVLPTLQQSTTKWIADLVVQELSKLSMVMDKEESLCKELAALKAQGSELDVRTQILLSEGSSVEESIQKFQEQKVELLAIKELIKKLEARASSLQAEIADGENKYSGFEASLDQLVKEKKLNKVSVDSTSRELLRTRAVSDTICTAIYTHLRQLF